MYRHFLCFILVSFFMVNNLYCQIFGGTSPAIHWKQINTNSFRIIYPDGNDSVANKIATIIQFTRNSTLHTIGKKTKKINIVLRNRGLVSNGYVSLSPFRSEFYLTPPQNALELGSTSWPETLTAHEYRHVQQYSNFDTGVSHLLKVIFGQEGQELANAGAIPDWFFEGDAVYTETNITRQGRGSLPYFYKGFRSLWRDDKNYSWMKLRNGSYRDFVPDKYPLGFMLVAYGYEKYGNDFWKKVTGNAAAYKSLFYPFQSAIKKYSGEDFVSFRKHAFGFFRSQFDDSVSTKSATGYYRNDQFPAMTDDGAIVFFRQSVKSIPAFYRRTGGKDIKIRNADVMIDNFFSASGNKIIYASTRPDSRWGYKAYNEIQVLDMHTGRQKTLTHNTRYFSPSSDIKNERIVAVNSKLNSTSTLDILDMNSGRVLKEITEPGILNYSYPIFYDRKIISCVSNNAGKMSLILFDPDTGKNEYLLPFGSNVISYPFIQNDTLYFSYSYKKQDLLFAYTFSDKKIWDVTVPNSPAGIYHFTATDTLAAFTTFSSQGFRIRQVNKSDLHFTEIPASKLILVTSSFGLMATNNVNSNLIYRLEDSTFAKKKYKKLYRPFNFHSLEPSVSDPEYTLSLVGENILNTIQSQISFTYNSADGSKKMGASIVYGGLYPVLTGGFDFNADQRFLRRDSFVYFNSYEPYLGFYIPWNLSKGRTFTSLTVGSNYKYNYTAFQQDYKQNYKNRSYSYTSSYVNFAHQVQAGSAQIFPRFAQSVYLNYKTPLTSLSGYQWLARARLFLPGIGRTHSFNITAAVSQKDTLKQINFSTSFPFARGYQGANLQRLEGWQFNYQLPLFYPEAGFANIVYLLRIRNNFFFDETTVKEPVAGKTFRRSFRSAGSEIFFDTRWWNQAAVSFGIRYAYLLDKDLFGHQGKSRWEIILPVNIFNK